MWQWLAPTMKRDAFTHLTYRIPYEELFDLSDFAVKQPPPKDHDPKTEYFAEDQLEAWDSEKMELQRLCDRMKVR